MPNFGDPLTILTYVLAVGIGFLLYFVLTKLKITKANGDATKIIEDATAKGDNIVKEAILDAKTQAYEYKLEAEKEIKEQRLEVTKFENKLLQREQNIDRRDIALQGKEDVLDEKNKQLDKKHEELEVDIAKPPNVFPPVSFISKRLAPKFVVPEIFSVTLNGFVVCVHLLYLFALKVLSVKLVSYISKNSNFEDNLYLASLVSNSTKAL